MSINKSSFQFLAVTNKVPKSIIPVCDLSHKEKIFRNKRETLSGTYHPGVTHTGEAIYRMNRDGGAKGIGTTPDWGYFGDKAGYIGGKNPNLRPCKLLISNGYMVEVAGIEPASANPTHTGGYMFSLRFGLTR